MTIPATIRWKKLDHSDPRVSILRNPGKGVVDAFNHGIVHSRGKYIARMDADDISLPKRLETQLEYLQKHPEVSIAGACVEIFSEQSLGGGNRHYQQWLNSVRTPGQVHRQLFIESPIPNPTAMFRRESLISLGGYKDVHWPEDYDLFLRADRQGYRMGKPEGILLKWRDHDTRLTRVDERYSRIHFQQAQSPLPGQQQTAGQSTGDLGRRFHRPPVA